MALLLETTIGDLVIDLDTGGSPALCKNVLKLAKARYYTGNLVYNVQPNRFCQLGDPCGDGTGGACIYGVLDAYERVRTTGAKPNVLASQRRFLKSDMGRELTEDECRQRGRVVATEMNGTPDTIGSQLLITVDEGPDRGLDGFRNTTSTDNDTTVAAGAFAPNERLTPQKFRSVGTVVEDENDVLGKLNAAYCDADGRPYADIRVIRALVIDDPYDDPEGMDQLLEDRGVTTTALEEGGKLTRTDDDDEASVGLRYRASASPDYERPPEETVEIRISVNEIETDKATDEEEFQKIRLQEQERLKREDKSRAIVLEMLGDLPSADIKAPENVLFICKLNSVTEDEDLELIFSRFDEKVSVEIVRDHKTGASLQYAFAEFTTKEQAAEAYFKMNNALVDDRRIKVDFSQSVSKVWDRFNQRERKEQSGNQAMPSDPFQEQPQQDKNHRVENRKRDMHCRGNDRKGGNNWSNEYFGRYDHNNHREDRYRDSSRRSSDRDHSRDKRYEKANDRDRTRMESHHDDRHHRREGADRHHRDRHHLDRHERDHRDRHEGRHYDDRDRNVDNYRRRDYERDDDRNSRSRYRYKDQRRRDESSPSHRREKKRRHDSDVENDSLSERSGRKHNRERRRCSRSRSSSRSEDERRQRKRSGHKKSKRKHDRHSDEDRRDRKRDKRDRKHRHHRSESSRHRRSPSDSI